MKNKFLFSFLFAVPILAILLIATVNRIYHPTAGAQARQLHETQAMWDKFQMFPISTNSQFLDQVELTSTNKNGVALTKDQKTSLRGVMMNMILANYLGDFNAYWHFIAPIEKYQVLEGTMQVETNEFASFFPGKDIPTKFQEIDKQIWSHEFSGHPFWTSIGLKDLNIELFTTNQIPFLELSALVPHNTFDFGSIRECYLTYDNVINDLLNKNKVITVAKITVMAETFDLQKKPRFDLQKKPRLFVYVFVEDPDDDTWLPVQMCYLSTTVMKYLPRF